MARHCPRDAVGKTEHCKVHAGAGDGLVPDDTVPDYCAISIDAADAKRAGPREWRSSNGFLDVTGTENVEIVIRHDGRVVWVHTGAGSLRICGIRNEVRVTDSFDPYKALVRFVGGSRSKPSRRRRRRRKNQSR
jgi:hypothetical protein